ncbi:MAG: lactococcin family bacteriocin [Frondihabitans sp.]|nr:lactococcin family bacteriocin [Frondihabitans sp.]
MTAEGREADADSPRVSRTVESAEGGTWEYGVNSRDVYSNYLHMSRPHGSSVKNGNGVIRRSEFVRKGGWSKIHLTKASPGNKAYYRFTP